MQVWYSEQGSRPKMQMVLAPAYHCFQMAQQCAQSTPACGGPRQYFKAPQLWTCLN